MPISAAHRFLAALSLALLAACGAEADPPESTEELESGETVNHDPAFIQVYVNNVENLETADEKCKGDYKDLLHYMDRSSLSPDLFIVQQISNRLQLDALIAILNKKLVGKFQGVIAEAHPHAFNSPCGAAKKLQTNAIIYRVGRFEPVGPKHVWSTWRRFGDECKRDGLARTKAVMQRFHDKVAKKHVTVASIHWSTSQGDGPDSACAKKNAIEVAAKLDKPAFAADLRIFAGDTNEPDRADPNGLSTSYRPWYAIANGDLGGALNYRDAIYDHCKSDPPIKRCLNENWSIGQDKRIDYLFAQRGDGSMPAIGSAHTISFEEADHAAKLEAGGDTSLNYSDHRAIRARIRY